MEKNKLEKFKNMLLEQKNQILNDIRNIAGETLNTSQRDSAGDLSGYSLHMADVGTDNFQRELTLGLVSNEQELLRNINEALQRVENGTYGHCEECDEIINDARLEALPFAHLCIKCKEKQEEGEGR